MGKVEGGRLKNALLCGISIIVPTGDREGNVPLNKLLRKKKSEFLSGEEKKQISFLQEMSMSREGIAA